MSRQDEIRASSDAKGVHNVLHLPLPELYRKEPYLSRQAHGALWIPGETVLEPCVYGLLLAHHARKNGAKVCQCQLCAYLEVSDCKVRYVDVDKWRTFVNDNFFYD